MKVNIRKFNKGPTSRKIDIQIDKWDTYGLDNTLALIILPALIQLKESKHGIPSEFVADTIADGYDGQRCFDFVTDDKDDVFEQGCQKWEETLDKMIWSFQQLVVDDYDSKYHHGNMKVEWRKTLKPIINPSTGKPEYMYEMVDTNPNEHWYDHVGHMKHEERIQEGLDLFGKYYRNLWD